MKRSFLFLFVIMTLSLLDACGGGGGTSSPPPPPPPPPPATVTHFSITSPANIPSAISFKFTVTALDDSNNTVTSYSGTVHFVSTDPHAQLPTDSTLMSGSNTFSALLTTPGNQVITASDKASSITGSSASINVGRFADAFPVEWFGAKGDGVTDDTAAIKDAISAAVASGGGSVVFNVARYFTSGSFVVPPGVVLCGAIEGPFDVAGVNPAAKAIAPTLLVTNTSEPFITLQGVGPGVTDLLFYYPNQVKASASVPIVYPFTILLASAGAKVARSTVTNAYNFLDIEAGRNVARDLFIGAFNIGVYIDHTQDFTTLHNLHHGVFWDEVENASYPTPIDSWVLNHGTALVVNRMDALEVDNFVAFSRFAGMLLTDSPDISLDMRSGNGRGSDILLHTVQYGIIVTSSTAGYAFTNLQVEAAPGLGQAAVQLRGGGTRPPDVLVNGGSVRGVWALGAFPTPQAGYLTHINIIGSDLP